MAPHSQWVDLTRLVPLTRLGSHSEFESVSMMVMHLARYLGSHLEFESVSMMVMHLARYLAYCLVGLME